MRSQCVLIVDDHPVVRRGLRAMLESESWVEEVVEAETMAAAVKEAVTRQVHVIAMDVGLPDGDGIEATRQIIRRRPGVSVLMLTLADDEDMVDRAIRAGARGYVLKDTDPDTIVDALRTVADGGMVLGPKIGPAVLSSLKRTPAALPAPFDQLTAKERDLLGRLVRGDNNSTIAKDVGVADKTIRNQLTPLFEKLGVSDRHEAAQLARDAGIAGLI